MIVRPAPLVAALALLATPAIAQDNPDTAPPEALEQAVEAEAEALAEAPAEPATGDVPETPAAPAPPPLAPISTAPAPLPQDPPPPSPFTPEQRYGWLMQCRNAFLAAGASYGGLDGSPDACETQLRDFERSYVATPGTPPPVIPVRVPIHRISVPAAPSDDPEGEE